MKKRQRINRFISMIATDLLHVLFLEDATHERLNAYAAELYTLCRDKPTCYSDLLRYRRGGAMLVSDSDSDRVGPWTEGYLHTTTGGSGQVGNREGLLSCLTSAER